MHHHLRARLGNNKPLIRWLFDPTTDVPIDSQPYLHGSLLAIPGVAIAGAAAGLLVAVTAALHTGQSKFWVLAGIGVAFLLLQLRAIRRCKRLVRAGTVPSVDLWIALMLGWCALQGLTAFAIGITGDLPMIVIATAFILGLVAPICTLHHSAPRLAVLLVMLCDLPFKLGLVLAGHPVLWILIPLSVPLFVSVRILLRNFAINLATSLKAAEDNRFLASHDPLTGLANRYGLDDQLQLMTSSPERTLTLLCLDLDRFKPINDRYGDATGDEVLVVVAERLRDVVGRQALIARMGGDEFLVAVRDLSPAAADDLANRLAGEIGGRPHILASGDRIGIGVSIGYACFPEDATNATALRSHADAALYIAKREGDVRRHAAGPPEGSIVA